MGTKMFKPGFQSSKGTERGVRYKPGSGDYDSGLVGDLVKLYSSGALEKLCPHWAGKDGFKDLMDILEPRIVSRADVEGLDADLFLEDIASCTLQSVELVGKPTAFSMLLDPIMQVLYNHGHDEHELNLSLFPPEYLEVGGKLEGDENRILKATFRGTFEDVGFFVKHVRLEIYGTVKWAGANAQSSEFILHDPVIFLGLNASDCAYHLLAEHDDYTMLQYGENNKFYFHKGLSREEKSRIRKGLNARHWLGERDALVMNWEQFFNKGNRIFIPKGKDEWEEIVPYGS